MDRSRQYSFVLPLVYHNTGAPASRLWPVKASRGAQTHNQAARAAPAAPPWSEAQFLPAKHELLLPLPQWNPHPRLALRPSPFISSFRFPSLYPLGAKQWSSSPHRIQEGRVQEPRPPLRAASWSWCARGTPLAHHLHSLGMPLGHQELPPWPGVPACRAGSQTAEAMAQTPPGASAQ